MGHAIVSLLLLRTKQRHDFNRSSAPPLPAWGVWEKISSKLRCIISLTDLVVFGQSLTTPWHLVSTNEVHHIYRTYHFPMLCHHFLHRANHVVAGLSQQLRNELSVPIIICHGGSPLFLDIVTYCPITIVFWSINAKSEEKKKGYWKLKKIQWGDCFGRNFTTTK